VISEVADQANLEAFRTIDDITFVAYLRAEDEAAHTSFRQMAEQYRDEFSFGVVSDPELISNAGINVPAVVCHRPEDEASETFTGFEDPEAFPKWLIEASRLVVSELTPHNHQRFLDRAWPMVYIFAETPAERTELRSTLKRFAKSQYESLTSVAVDPLDFPDLPARLGLTPGRFPAGAVHQLSKDRVYPYPYGRGLTSNDLTKWGIDVWQGRVKPWTPPGVTTSYDDLGPTRVATRRVSVMKIPGMGSAIKIAGLPHDEL
jgi:protein disulfide-isomerase A1